LKQSSSIRILTEETINQIAAGEVVENPAAVVKELVENAIDAGSSAIYIEVKGGGFQQIVVADDGKGMSSDDAVLCFERHATSKIAHIDDLASLRSMGFRGEALASIAAIARVEMTTAEEEGTGVQVLITAGKIESVVPAPRRKGTTFAVRSLFFNVPARKKFQKQAAASQAEIHRLVISLALAHPEVGFELVFQEAAVLKVSPADLQRRMEDLFQGSFLREKLKIEGEERGYRLHGFIGTAADHRLNRTGQHLFVNSRPIFSSQVSRVVKEAYGERLASDRYPVFVLHLQVPAPLIDVNVHPQKKEVRFQEHDVIRRVVLQSVQKAFVPIQPEFTPPPVFFDEPAPLRFREEAPQESVLFQQEEVIGVFDHYLLLDGSTVEGCKEGIVFVDLHKAEVEVVCEKQAQSQGLLLPLPIELTAVEIEKLQEKKEELARLGFVVQESGKRAILVEAIPSFVEEDDVKDLIVLVLESEEEFLTLSRKAARFALRRKKTFSLHEAIALWNRFKHLNSCGAMRELHTDEIDKFFKTDGQGAISLRRVGSSRGSD
jgi:DNA mismatch repair protein MutL